MTTVFNVLFWDFNKSTPGPYDVLPYFRRRYEECKKKERPVTKDQWKEFIERWGRYQYWARCEYETIIGQWPPTDKSYKLDIWEQISWNLDLIAEILLKEYENNSKPNTK